MRIRLLAVGKRMPQWVDTAFNDYARRLPREYGFELVAIAPGKRAGGDTVRAVEAEDTRMAAAIGHDTEAIALSAEGKAVSSETLANHLRDWLAEGRDRALLVGGPDGLGRESRARASRCWSLSAMTLAHPLVRVMVAEQLYRAHSIISGHPYHRG